MIYNLFHLSLDSLVTLRCSILLKRGASHMKIEDVEKQVGISVHSIRFYEEIGLIEINRSKGSKYRDFTQQDIEKLKEVNYPHFRRWGLL